VASIGLLAGCAWYAVGLTLAAGVVLAGPGAGGWSTAVVGAPLAIGWVVQVLVASWTHLLPSIGPGGPGEHARQRTALGRLATVRLVALNLGVALLAIGWAVGDARLAAIGAVGVGVAVLVSVALAVRAVTLARPG
jgi:hypothetical protein